MHTGSLATSARLQATLACISDGQWHSTREIATRTFSMAVHSDMAALKANGIAYDREQRGRVHYYRLARMGQMELAV
jgi:hypothetical protein